MPSGSIGLLLLILVVTAGLCRSGWILLLWGSVRIVGAGYVSEWIVHA